LIGVDPEHLVEGQEVGLAHSESRRNTPP